MPKTIHLTASFLYELYRPLGGDILDMDAAFLKTIQERNWSDATDILVLMDHHYKSLAISRMRPSSDGKRNFFPELKNIIFYGQAEMMHYKDVSFSIDSEQLNKFQKHSIRLMITNSLLAYCNDKYDDAVKSYHGLDEQPIVQALAYDLGSKSIEEIYDAEKELLGKLACPDFVLPSDLLKDGVANYSSESFLSFPHFDDAKLNVSTEGVNLLSNAAIVEKSQKSSQCIIL